jgi:hypothetical protein
MKTKILLNTLLLIVLFNVSNANNVQTNNVVLNGQNISNSFSMVNFDISWENSWRTSSNESNYDGCWVFVKFRKHGTSTWQHATLNATGHIASLGATLETPTDGKGVFIYRDANGIGNVNFMGNQLRWNYGIDGIADNDSVEIKVCAIEMAYVPQGAFYVGTGASEFNSFYKYDSANPANVFNPYLISSANSIAVGNTNNGTLFYPNFYNTGYPNYFLGGGDGAGPIPSTFPNGYESFWIMKYECSQQQYTDFLNMLDAARAANRMAANITGSFPAFVATNPERAQIDLNTGDLYAYSDWAGLRPMTELEYEKACRGANNMPVPNEFAWGNTTLLPSTTITNAGLFNEVSTDSNTNYFSFSGIKRCGMFARPNTDRVLSGGTYYGVMDMTANVSEQTITVGSPANRLFNKTIHGDGNLTASGNSNISIWTNCSILNKGGKNGSPIDQLKVSNRFFDTYTETGIRLVRTGN